MEENPDIEIVVLSDEMIEEELKNTLQEVPKLTTAIRVVRDKLRSRGYTVSIDRVRKIARRMVFQGD